MKEGKSRSIMAGRVQASFSWNSHLWGVLWAEGGGIFDPLGVGVRGGTPLHCCSTTPPPDAEGAGLKMTFFTRKLAWSATDLRGGGGCLLQKNKAHSSSNIFFCIVAEYHWGIIGQCWSSHSLSDCGNCAWKLHSNKGSSPSSSSMLSLFIMTYGVATATTMRVLLSWLVLCAFLFQGSMLRPTPCLGW